MDIKGTIRKFWRRFLFWAVGRQIGSLRDLTRLISEARVVSESDKKLILAAIKFPRVKLADIMTPKTDITFVRDSIHLGPKVLDELYATGQKIFPVAHASLDDAIGVIYLEDITEVAKGEQTLSQATHLRPPVLSQKLSASQALVEMLKNNANLAMVGDGDGKIIGMVELRTILEVLLGYAIR
ncbi:MAG: CBS domain-containing protein [Candidatus Nomurabacteria bacterium]|jgi:CBS domain containing-hemolysin-like protein|nr:CBS domain-containing protein [Candidatus Nomurabacteria bacterium]